MQTKKSIAKGLLALLILSVCLWIGTQIYDYHHPYLEISYGTAHSDNILKTMPTVIIIEKSLLGYSSEIKQQLKEWHIAVTDMEVSFNNHYEKPLCIINDFEVKNGKTYVYYKGFGMSKATGELESISEVIVFDFVLTENLP